MINEVMNFDAEGRWDIEVGPAIHAPNEVKNIVITEYRVEWLDISDPEHDFFAKNHMVAAVTFAEVQTINGTMYSSTRLSMELGPEKVVSDTGDGYVSGEHYNPGTYTVTLLQFKDPTFRSTHHLTYTLREGTTVGTLIDQIIELEMHHFLFLPYTSEGRWKGCGDHALHCWAVFVRNGDIISKGSLENPGISLSTEFTQTYFNGASTYELIGRGWWIRHDPVEDEHTPETAFSPARLTHQL